MVDINTVKASVVVQFGSSTGITGHLSAEIDGRSEADNGLNNGNTSFSPGDAVYILTYKSNNVVITEELASHGGTVYPHANVNVLVEDTLTFTKTKTTSLSKPISGSLTTTWLGNNLGNITIDTDQVTARISSDTGVGIAKVTYTSMAKAYRVTTPLTLGGESNYSIVVLFIGEKS